MIRNARRTIVRQLLRNPYSILEFLPMLVELLCAHLLKVHDSPVESEGLLIVAFLRIG